LMVQEFPSQANADPLPPYCTFYALA